MRLQLLHLRLDAGRRIEHVRAGQLEDAHSDRRHVVEVVADVLALRPQFEPRHVAQSGDLPVGPGLQHDLAELLRLGEAAQRGHGVLEVDPFGGRRLSGLSGGHLHVLLAQRLDHVARRQVAGSQPVGIQPHPHAVILLAEDEHVAHSLQSRQRVPDLDQGVVAHVQLVVPPFGRIEVHDEHQVGRPLLDRHADLFHHVGQNRLGQGDAVLHQHLGHVQIRADLEGDHQAVAAVVAALRRHVEHVFHAVDLLLDRRGHGVGHHLCVGAGIVADDLNRRRRDLGILRHRQIINRRQPEQRDQDRRHGGQDRAVNEITGKHRRAGLLGRFAATGCLGHRRSDDGDPATLFSSRCRGVTVIPGRARCNPLTITQSSGPMPDSITIMPFVQGSRLDLPIFHLRFPCSPSTGIAPADRG